MIQRTLGWESEHVSKKVKNFQETRERELNLRTSSYKMFSFYEKRDLSSDGAAFLFTEL